MSSTAIKKNLPSFNERSIRGNAVAYTTPPPIFKEKTGNPHHLFVFCSRGRSHHSPLVLRRDYTAAGVQEGI
jgi:hypothetical protein